MSNQYHLLVATPEARLVEGMKWVQNTYTRRFNVRHGQRGRLFGDRYKSVMVEGEGYYDETLMDTIHLNPARAGGDRPGGIERITWKRFTQSGPGGFDRAEMNGRDG
jgi:hypothetical protein